LLGAAVVLAAVLFVALSGTAPTAAPGPAYEPLSPTPTQAAATLAPTVAATPTATAAPTIAPTAAAEAYPAEEKPRWEWWKLEVDALVSALEIKDARCVDTSKYNEYFYGCKKNTAGGVTEYSFSIQAHNTKNFNATYALPAGRPVETVSGRTIANYPTGDHRVLVAPCFSGWGLAKYEFPTSQDIEKYKKLLVENCPE